MYCLEKQIAPEDFSMVAFLLKIDIYPNIPLGQC